MSRILVVDDDGFFRKVITKLLSGHGHEISAVESGLEALQVLQDQPFDLMISDVNMTPWTEWNCWSRRFRHIRTWA